jgi:hypothetical protein
VYDQPPSVKGAKIVELYRQDSSEVSIGAKSAQGGLSSENIIGR